MISLLMILGKSEFIYNKFYSIPGLNGILNEFRRASSSEHHSYFILIHYELCWNGKNNIGIKTLIFSLHNKMHISLKSHAPSPVRAEQIK